MAGRPLATAFVRIRMLVDPREARRDVDSALNSAGLDKSGLEQGQKAGSQFAAGLKDRLARDIGKSAAKISVDVSVNDLTAQRSLASLQAARDDLAKRLTTLRVGADDKTAQAALLRLNAQMDTLSRRLATPGVDLKGADRIQAQILSIGAAMDKLSKTVTKPMDTVVLTDKAKAKLLEVDAEAKKLRDKFPEFTVTINDTAAKRKLAIFAAEAKATTDKINKGLSGAGDSGGIGGIASKIGGLFPGGGSGAGSILSGAGSSIAGLPWPAIAGITAAATAALPVLTSLTTVAAGAGAGLAAFGAVGAQAYGKLTSNIAALHTANEKFSESALNVDTAISTSAADAKVYNAALAKMPPNLASAAKLLGDQNVRWQDLSTSQQNNVVALANNKDALKTLLPSQKTALTQLIAGKKAWDDMSPAQQAAATNMQKVSDAWSKLTTAMSPVVLGVIAQAAGFAVKAIGPIGDIAKAATPGITQMVNILGTGLISFLKGITPLIGPSMGAFNSILQSIFQAINNGLVPAMVAGLPNFVKMAVFAGKVTGALIDMLGALFRVSSWLITQGITAWHWLADATDRARIAIVNVGSASISAFIVTLKAFKFLSDGVLGFIGGIINGAAKAFGWVPGIGKNLKDAAKNFDGFRASTDASFNRMINTAQAWQKELLNGNSISARAARQIVGDFAAQQQAASKANGGLATYTDTIRIQGVTSNAARKDRQNLINDMIGAGVKASVAKTDVAAYTTAVRDNGVGSQQALQAREKLVSDIFNATVNAQRGKTDMAAYTTAVRDNGAKSDAAKTARKKLIDDLVAAGVSAQNANNLVNGLSTGIKNIPGSKSVSIHVSGTGNWSISQSKNTNFGSGLLAGTKFSGAAGGIIPGYAPGVDSVLAAVSPGEAIIVPEAVRAIGAGNIMAINRAYAPGRTSQGMAFAGGGLVAGNFAGLAPWTTAQYDATVRAMAGQVGAAISEGINTAVAQARAAAQAHTAGTGGFLGDSGVRSGSAALAQAFARSIMGQYGWGANQWPPWLYLGNQESGWSAYAVNKSSGAYGIGQSLGHGHPYNLGDYQNQVIWMANYIKGRYGTPAVAWGHEQAFNWYGGGGTIMEPVTGVGLRTGRRYGFGENGPETVTPGIGHGGDGRVAALLERLIDVAAAIPAATGAHVGGAINDSAAAASFRSRYPIGGA